MKPTRFLPLLLSSCLVLTACDKLGGGGDEDGDEMAEDDGGSSSRGSTSKAKKAKKRSGKKLPIKWKKDTEFSVKGKPKQKGRVSIYKGTYQITVYGFPKGTSWKVGDKEGEVDSKVLEIIKFKEMIAEMGGAPVDKPKRHKVDPKAKLELDLPNGDYVTFDLPPAELSLSLEDVLKKVENGPVLFGKEPPDEKPKQSIMFLHSSWKVFGRASKMQDVDGVAIAHLLDDVKGTKTCSGYKSNKGKKMPDIELQLKETEVTVFERRTGDVWVKKVFPPNDRCPMFAFQSKDSNKKDSSIPTRKIEGWLRTQVKR